MPKIYFLTTLIISITALSAAFFSEAFLGLEPCQLCIYQRWPFAIGIVIAIIGLLLIKAHKPNLALGLVVTSGLTYLINSGIAFYHTGVEQKWWSSRVEGCSATFEVSDSVSKTGEFSAADISSILENIMSAPMADCSEIPWQDPILGLSMANYNVVLCFWLFTFAVFSIIKRNMFSRPTHP